MNSPECRTTEKHRANTAYAIGYAMEAASKQGAPDAIIAQEVVRVALALIGAANGGPLGIPDALDRIATDLRDDPGASVTLQ